AQPGASRRVHWRRRRVLDSEARGDGRPGRGAAARHCGQRQATRSRRRHWRRAQANGDHARCYHQDASERQLRRSGQRAAQVRAGRQARRGKRRPAGWRLRRRAGRLRRPRLGPPRARSCWLRRAGPHHGRTRARLRLRGGAAAGRWLPGAVRGLGAWRLRGLRARRGGAHARRLRGLRGAAHGRGTHGRLCGGTSQRRPPSDRLGRFRVLAGDRRPKGPGGWGRHRLRLLPSAARARGRRHCAGVRRVWGGSRRSCTRAAASGHGAARHREPVLPAGGPAWQTWRRRRGARAAGGDAVAHGTVAVGRARAGRAGAGPARLRLRGDGGPGGRSVAARLGRRRHTPARAIRRPSGRAGARAQASCRESRPLVGGRIRPYGVSRAVRRCRPPSAAAGPSRVPATDAVARAPACRAAAPRRGAPPADAAS
ncbi:unnamed protein product, partial [Prorocentrum cordatum]